MHFNFELILFYASLISGLIYLADICYFARKRQQLATPQEVKNPANH